MIYLLVCEGLTGGMKFRIVPSAQPEYGYMHGVLQSVRCFCLSWMLFTVPSLSFAHEILGTDQQGIPILCGDATGATASNAYAPLGKKPPPPPPVLPVGMRMWETIPGVIRNNGSDTFRIEVNVNGTVSNVTMAVYDNFLTQSGQTNIVFHDDGLNGDRVAGDGIYTSEPILFNTNLDVDLAPYYWWDTNSPAGVMAYFPGNVYVGETNGAQSQFLIRPEIGILDKNIPLTQTVQLSSNVVVSAHFINVLGTNLFTQKFLREASSDVAELPRKMYSVLPDAFDFFVYFSMYHIEYVPYESYFEDGIAGAHYSIQINYTGTGQGLSDNSAVCGSAGRLLGISALDSYDRGMSSGNCSHEIMHQWASFMAAFPFSDGSHYTSHSSAGSPVGGGVWDDNGDGTWTLDCNYQTNLDVFDQYLMGLVTTDSVPPLRVYSSTSSVYCGGIITNIVSTTTIRDIVNTYGLRTPGPATAKRNFSIGFVGETYQRLLTPVEMTYYEIFAAHFTAPIPRGHPDPKIYYSWASIADFFGGGTTWSSDALLLFRPAAQSLQTLSDGHCTIGGQGLAGQTYRLETSTNLTSWTTITNKTAGTNGTFSVSVARANITRGYYRWAWP